MIKKSHTEIEKNCLEILYRKKLLEEVNQQNECMTTSDCIKLS